jgi:hypothetical protein
MISLNGSVCFLKFVFHSAWLNGTGSSGKVGVSAGAAVGKRFAVAEIVGVPGFVDAHAVRTSIAPNVKRIVFIRSPLSTGVTVRMLGYGEA